MENDSEMNNNEQAQFEQRLQELHSDALRRYEASISAEREQRDKCLEDMQFVFVPGSQWDHLEAQSRNDRPRFEINKVILPINQAIGEQRQNRISVKVRPSKGMASKEVADVYSGLIRFIENKSHFSEIKDNAFKEIASGGFGGWYVTTEYSDSESFDQDVVIKPIRSAASSIYYDPASKDELKRDANWFIVTEDIDKETFNARYPGKSASNMAKATSPMIKEWQTRDTVRIADYWVKEPVMIELALMSDGSVIEMTPENQTVLDDMAAMGITVLRTRMRESHRVMMYKMSAGEILEGPFEWAGQYIPVVPVFGYNVWINGQHYYQGMVRNARDAQRVYNYATSQAIETSALSPKDPYWITPKQALGHEKQLQTFNVRNTPFMFYNPDDEAGGPPQRTGAPSVQQALITQVQQADADIMSSTGQFQPSLGDQVNDQSGRAILALQRKGHAATHELIDNLTKAVQYTGEILVDLIPKIYDTERQISILGEDGSASPLVINQTIIDQQTGLEVVVNDLSQGKYDVVADVGPTFDTQRSESLNLLTKLAESNPMFAQVSADLIAQSVDFNYAEELTSRIRKQMLQQGLVDPTPEEAQQIAAMAPQEPSPTEQLNFKMLQLQAEQQAAIVDNLELQNEKIKADIVHKHSETNETFSKTLKNKSQAAKYMSDAGLPAMMEVGNSQEFAARQRNLQLMNDQLVLTIDDLENLQDERMPAAFARASQAAESILRGINSGQLNEAAETALNRAQSGGNATIPGPAEEL